MGVAAKKSLPADHNFTSQKLTEPLGARGKHHFFDEKDQEYKEVAEGYKHQDYPKMMYHPEWGKIAMPDMGQFGGGAVTLAEAQARNVAFNEAMQNWRRKNRVKYATDSKHEKRLLDKGWLLKPDIKDQAINAFDMDSDEV